MKPVVFAGEVPEHLMSAAAITARDLRAQEESLERLNVGRSVEVLQGDLNASTTEQILDAALRILKQPWNDKLDPQPKNLPSLPDAEVTSLVTRGLKHLQASSADPTSPQYWQKWTYVEYHTFSIVAGLVAKFGCSEDLAKLAWPQLTSGCARYTHQLSTAFYAHAAALHATDPAKADDFEFNVVRSAPGYFPRRHGPWVTPSLPIDGLPCSKEFAQRVLAVMTEEQVANFIGSCDYDWLPADLVHRAMLVQPRVERSQRFSTATKEQVRKLFEDLVPHSDITVACLSSIPAWKEFAADLEAMRPAFQASPFTNDGTEMRMNLKRVNTLLHVAQELPASTATALLTDLAKAGMRELAAAPADKARSLASSFTDLICHLANQAGWNVDFVRHSLLAHDFLNKPNVCPNGMAALDGELGTDCDDKIRRQLKQSKLPAEVVTAYRAMFIEAGLLSIGSIRPVHQRKDIIGPALSRNPERLAEVTDLERFMDLARRFSIPVELPDTVLPELRTQASMQSSMTRHADPLAGVAESPAPRRAARRP